MVSKLGTEERSERPESMGSDSDFHTLIAQSIGWLVILVCAGRVARYSGMLIQLAQEDCVGHDV